MSRRLPWFAFALCAAAQAAAQPIELTLTPAFKGWARPGRATEVAVGVSSRSATSGEIELRFGLQSLRAHLDLQPGRAQRLHLPAAAADELGVRVRAAAAAPIEIRRLEIARSERPLLGVALSDAAGVGLDGFQVLALSADDLPRHAASHAAIDALVLDAATLQALDAQQMAALLGHLAGCGRVVLVQAAAATRQALEGAAGCSGRTLMSADSAAQAPGLLSASLRDRLPAPMSLGEAGALVRPGLGAWTGTALALTAYAALLVLMLVFGSPLPALLAVPALAALAAWGVPQWMQPTAQWTLWSEGESGARLARYQGWQQLAGLARVPVRMPVPAQLGSAVRPCDAKQAMHFEFDARRGLTVAVGFETRLFRNVVLCHAGSFAMARAFTLDTGADGVRRVHNKGATAWPPGYLLAAGQVHDLPAVEAGAAVPVAVQPKADAEVLRTAAARSTGRGAALLWALDLSGVDGLGPQDRGWLLVSGAGR